MTMMSSKTRKIPSENDAMRGDIDTVEVVAVTVVVVPVVLDLLVDPEVVNVHEALDHHVCLLGHPSRL